MSNPAHGLEAPLIDRRSRQSDIEQSANDRFAETPDRDTRLQFGDPALHQFTVQGALSGFSQTFVGA